MSELTVRDLCEAMWDAERRFGLLDWKVGAVHPWLARRLDIYYQLAKKAGTFQAPYLGASRLRSLGLASGVFRGLTFKNPLWQKGPVDALVVEHARSVKVGDRVVDVYTDDLVEDMRREKKKIISVELPYGGFHAKSGDRSRFFLDGLYAQAAVKAKTLPANSFDRSEIERVGREVEQHFLKTIGISWNPAPLMWKGYQRFVYLQPLLETMLKTIRPKEIFVVIGYAHPELISTAKRMGIRTTEIQHGTFSRYHLGYSFPDRKEEVAYFPDHVCVWSEMWRSMAPFPIAPENVLVRPFAHMELGMKKYRGVEKVPGQVVVLSQGVIGPKIADVLLKNREWFQGKQVVYKLHPAEFNAYMDVESYRRLKSEMGVEFALKVDLYDLLARSEYQVGVFSTAVYEGVEFGCQTLLLDLPGVEYMQDLLDSGKAKLLDGRVR